MLRRKLRRDLRRQRAQFAAVGVTVLLGVALFGATYEAYRSLKASYDAAFVRYRFANLTISGGAIAELAQRARATPGVAAVQARVQADVPMQARRRQAARPDRRDPCRCAAGRQPRPPAPGSLPGRVGVLVEDHTAAHFRLAPADRLTVRGASLLVVGVAASSEYFWPAKSRQEVLVAADDFAVLFVPEPLAERLAGTRPKPAGDLLRSRRARRGAHRGACPPPPTRPARPRR